MSYTDLNPIAAIIPAAGQGTRLGGHTKKQFQLLGGKPLLLRTVERILLADEIRWVIIALPESHVESTKEILQEAIPAHVDLILTPGGKTRQISVSRALDQLPNEARIVTVHDAARPFLDPAWISQSAQLCNDFDGAIVAIPSQDTLKEVGSIRDNRSPDAVGKVIRTVSRDIVWQAQTPQTFKTNMLRIAMANAVEKGISGTDEAFLVEEIGGVLAIVKGSPSNYKITTRNDWDYAEWRLEHDPDRHRG